MVRLIKILLKWEFVVSTMVIFYSTSLQCNRARELFYLLHGFWHNRRTT